MNEKTFNFDSFITEKVSTFLEEEMKEIKLMIISLSNSNNNFPKYMDLGAACSYLSVSRNTLNKYIYNYDLPIIQIDGVKRMSKHDLDTFMHNHKC